MNTTNKARRFNNCCKACGAKFSVLAESVWVGGKIDTIYRSPSGFEFADYNYRLVYECECGTKRLAKPVLGKFNPGKTCNDKCLSATGHQCECSCGGKNHGAGNDPEAHAHKEAA